MQPNDSEPLDSTSEAAKLPPSADVPAPATIPHRGSPGRYLVAIATAAGLLAGGLAWMIGETRIVVVKPVEVEIPLMGSGPLVPSTTPEADRAAKRQTAARALGVLGALLGLSLGLAGGMVIGPRYRAAAAGMLGLGLGAILAASIAWVAMSTIEGRRLKRPDDLTLALLLHAACWLPIGAVGGAALGSGDRGRMIAGASGGILGALLATVLYEVLGAILFPLAGTSQLISTAPTSRLLATLLVPTLAAAAAALSISRRSATAKS